MNYQETETYLYLISLQTYLLGDLNKFQQLCNEAEIQEKENYEDSSEDSTTNVNTMKTTSYPFSFEFLIGTPIVSRSTIPHTASLFATIDILGFLTRTGKDYIATKKNFEEFFKCLNPQLSPTEINVLVSVFRHGMTHGFFPILKMEISCHSLNPIEKIFLKSKNGNLVLNVNHLLAIVPKRLEEIINDESLYNNMELQFNYLMQEYESKCRNDITSLLSKL